MLVKKLKKARIKSREGDGDGKRLSKIYRENTKMKRRCRRGREQGKERKGIEDPVVFHFTICLISLLSISLFRKLFHYHLKNLISLITLSTESENSARYQLSGNLQFWFSAPY